MNLRDSLLTDIYYELDKVDFQNTAVCDDSYEYIRTNFLIDFNGKGASDGSICETEKQEILRILDDESDNLLNCYMKLIDYLEKNKRRNKTMKTFQTPTHKNLEFAFKTGSYSTTGNTYVGIRCKENDCIEPYCNLTVNLDMPLGKRHAFIDVNNADHSLLRFLEEQDFIAPTGVTMPSGFVVYPLYRLNLEKIEEYTGL